MKLSAGILLTALASSAAAAASRDARVFVYDPVSKEVPHDYDVVSPPTARLILAHRLGLSRFHSIGDVDVRMLGQLNAYGGKQALFGGANPREHNSAHLMVWIEDVENVADIIKDQLLYPAAFNITDPPSPSENDRLLEDMILQAKSLPKKTDPKLKTFHATVNNEAAFQAVGKPKALTIVNDFWSFFRADKSNLESFATISDILDDVVRRNADDKGAGFSVTVVLMPPSSSHSKRAASPYGEYQVPSARKGEAFLSLASSQPSAGPQNPSVPNLEDFPTVQQASDSSFFNKSAILGILPPYFKSEQLCVEATNNCSGHGLCDLRRNGRYSCVCTPTVEHVGEDHGMESKRQVTYWGGPACQKRDVSQPFWLFVSVGVLLAFLISAGIGMMYSMGDEELPSVIGAGVSGPTRK